MNILGHGCGKVSSTDTTEFIILFWVCAYCFRLNCFDAVFVCVCVCISPCVKTNGIVCLVVDRCVCVSVYIKFMCAYLPHPNIYRVHTQVHTNYIA